MSSKDYNPNNDAPVRQLGTNYIGPLGSAPARNADPAPWIKEAIRLIEGVIYSTTCPDPGEGGCIGGPIPGYGCLNEAARSARRRLEEGKVEEAVKVLELIRAKVDGRIEVVAALNVLRSIPKQEA
jgi:hypothetical protein